MPTLYLIRGCPGSGKSTFAYNLFDCGLVDNIFEADQFFQKVGSYEFVPQLIGEAHQECQQNTIRALRLGLSVAVSNTSTTEREVETYAKIAEEAGAKFVSIVVENRHGGTNLHNVPEEKIEQMRKRFSVKL